jgi:aryl-alcohol dehydrogenase-like predicted oxidoreductase
LDTQFREAVHRISFVQNEYSLIQREPEKGLLTYLNDQSIEFVCYSPLGRGILGRIPDVKTKRASTDYRAKDPRFEPGRLAEISRALDPLWDNRRRNKLVASLAIRPLITIESLRRAQPRRSYAATFFPPLHDASTTEISS